MSPKPAKDHSDKAPTPAVTDTDGRERFTRNVLFAWGGYLVNVVMGFVIPRLISDRLGQVELGIWDFSWSIVTYFGLVQLGLGSSINRYVARHRANGDVEGLNRSVSTITLFMRWVGWLAFGLALIAAFWVLPLFAGQLQDGLAESRWVILFLGIEVALSIMLAVYGAVIVGCHRWDIHNTVSASIYAAIAVAMVAILLAGGRLPHLAAAHCVLMVGGELIRWRLVHRVCPELRLSRKLASRSVFFEQARYSAKSLVPRVADLLSNQTAALLLTGFLGPASLAVFSRPRGLLRTVQTMAGKFGAIVVPTASSLHARKDTEALRATLLAAPAGLAAVALPVLLLLAICSDAIMRFWMGPAYVYPGLMALLALGIFPAVVQEPVWSLLAGMNAHGRLALAKLGSAFASAALLFAGLAWFDAGLTGAAACLIIPHMLVDGVFTPMTACSRLEVSLATYYWSAFIRPLLAVLPFSIGAVASQYLNPASWLWSMAALCGGSAISACLYWRYLLPGTIKSRIAALFGWVSSRQRTRESVL